jgi:hypothetical protein
MFLFALSSGDLDENEIMRQYEEWRIGVENGRRPPIKFAPPEAEWVGGKSGMYMQSPDWLNKAYTNGMKTTTKWRGVEPRYEKDYSEFEIAHDGPFGFRDKHPDWIDRFGNQIWQEQLSISRKLARAFGTYRKTMWKIDSDVQLQSCDGADKEEEEVDLE